MNKLIYKNSNVLALSCAGLFFASHAMFAQKDSRPNIIFILADDLGYGDLSCLNNQSKIQTPNLDKLAGKGVVFTDAHSSSAVSTPTRYGILTGRYNWRSNLKQGVLGCYNKPLIPSDRTTMASMLRNRGYKTACIGKWHLGMNFPTTNDKAPVDNEKEYNLDFSRPITGGPTDVGFDYFFGMDAPNYSPYCFIENRQTVGIPSVYYPVNSELDCRAGRGIANWKHEDVLPALKDRAVQYIREAAKKEDPFFIYLPLMSPHTPIVPSAPFKGKSGLNLYADFVMQTDAVVGEIVKALEKSKLDNNTIIVFTSDNGCSPRADFQALKEKGHNPGYIYRGMKSDLFEGGHHIPCIVSWPAKVKPHTVEQTVCLTDFMATFASVTGYKLADNEGEDSYNILPLLTDPACGQTIREATVHHSIDGSFAIRQGKWKLLLSSYSGGWSEPKKAQADKHMFQLYDLEKDPGETQNLYLTYPEIAGNMQALVTKYIKEGRSTPGATQKNDGVYPWKQLWWMAESSFADQWEFAGTAIEEPGYHVWGSSPIQTEDGKVHLFATRWKTEHKFDPGWRSHSEIARYVSDSPDGPFRFQEVVLTGTGKDTWDKCGIHNPAIHKVGNQYVLLYISNNNYHQPPHPKNQRIGMLVADHINGPWRKAGKDGCILSPSANPAHWTHNAGNGVVNPALLQHPGGGYLLYFKSDKSKMGVAFAENVEGPYVMYPEPVTRNNVAIEDGYAFIYNGQICLLTTDNHGIIKKGGGILWKSDNGIEFNEKEAGFHLFEEYAGKENLKNHKQLYGTHPKFERPQVLLQNGNPAYLYVPSGANMKGNDGTAVYILKFKGVKK